MEAKTRAMAGSAKKKNFFADRAGSVNASLSK